MTRGGGGSPQFETVLDCNHSNADSNYTSPDTLPKARRWVTHPYPVPSSPPGLGTASLEDPSPVRLGVAERDAGPSGLPQMHRFYGEVDQAEPRHLVG